MLWSLKLSFKLDKFVTILLIVSTTAAELKSILNIYIFALVLDKAVSVASGAQPDVSKMILYLALLLGVELFSNLVNDIRNYAQNLIRQKVGIYIRRELYVQADRIGVELLEDPEISNNLQRAERKFMKCPTF